MSFGGAGKQILLSSHRAELAVWMVSSLYLLYKHLLCGRELDDNIFFIFIFPEQAQ